MVRTYIIFVEHQNIRLDALCLHNKCMIEMNDYRTKAVIIIICGDMKKLGFFANGGDSWHASIFQSVL